MNNNDSSKLMIFFLSWKADSFHSGEERTSSWSRKNNVHMPVRRSNNTIQLNNPQGMKTSNNSWVFA